MPGLPHPLSRRIFQWIYLLVLSTWTSAVLAHATLVSSTPPAGELLPEAPASVQLVFNEPVSPLLTKLIQPDGSVLEIIDVKTLSTVMDIRLPSIRQRGNYGLSWRVISTDGHPVGGTVTFSVADRSPSTAVKAPAITDRQFLIWLARLCAYISLFFGIGMTAWLTKTGLQRPSGCTTLRFRLLVLGAVASLSSLGLLGLDALDLPLSGLFHIRTWLLAAQTSFGLSTVLALLALGCAFMSRPRAKATAPHVPHVPHVPALMALALLGTSLAVSGHASTAPPVWVARPALWLHALAIALWLGALPLLADTLRKQGGPTLLTWFSRLIPAILLLLLISGLILVWLQLDQPSSLWQTAYGQILLIKLTLVAMLTGLGAFNRYRLTKAVLHAAPHARSSARHTMRRIVHVEWILAAGILAIVALWRFTPPPRALIDTRPTTSTIVAVTHAQHKDIKAKLSIMTERSGKPSALLQLSGPGPTPLMAQEVDLAFSSPQAGIQPIRFTATRSDGSAEGQWQIRDLSLPYQKHWQIRIAILVSDFERTYLSTALELPDSMELSAQ